MKFLLCSFVFCSFVFGSERVLTFGQRSITLESMRVAVEDMAAALKIQNTSEFLAVSMNYSKRQKHMDYLCSPAGNTFSDFTCIDRRRVERSARALFHTALPSVMALQKRRLHTLAEYQKRLGIRLSADRIEIGEQRELFGGLIANGMMPNPWPAMATRTYDETETLLTMVEQYLKQIRRYTRLFLVEQESIEVMAGWEKETRRVCSEIREARDGFVSSVRAFDTMGYPHTGASPPLETIDEVENA